MPILQKCIDHHNANLYIEPFVGGANVIEHIQCETKLGLDSNNYLICFLSAIQQGWNPLTELDIDKSLYQNIRENKLQYPPALVGLAGFCASYNGKWFGGYAGSVNTRIGTVRNYYDEAVRNVLKQSSKLNDTVFRWFDYRILEPCKIQQAVIYCDPPYADTTGYHSSFNSDSFWKWAAEMSVNNYLFVSEYNAPGNFECIWEMGINTTLDKASRHERRERLFVLKERWNY